MWAAASFSSGLKAQARSRRDRPTRSRSSAPRPQPEVDRAPARRRSLRAAVESEPPRAIGTACRTCCMEAASQGLAIVATRFRRHPGIHPPRRRGRARAAGRLGGAVERHQSPGARSGPPRGSRRRGLRRGCAGIFPWRAASTCWRSASARCCACPAQRIRSRREPCRAVPVAFYAPLKSPDHPLPSGDRTMARLLLKALGEAGFAPELASELRTLDRGGDAAFQDDVRGSSRSPRPIALDRALIERLRRQTAAAPLVHLSCLLQGAGLDRPARRRRARASPMSLPKAPRAGKRARGAWARGHAGAEAALDRADAIFVMTEARPRGSRDGAAAAGQRLARAAALHRPARTGQHPSARDADEARAARSSRSR